MNSRGRTIKKSKLLYRFDLISKVNFLTYISNKRDILFLLSLETGAVVAGYSYYQVNKNTVPGIGFLGSLTTGKVCTVTQKNTKSAKLISPDAQNIIFGNSQLRIRAGEKVVFSNLGIAQSYLDSKDKNLTVSQLLGTDNKKQTEIKTYQFYQLFFDE